MVNYLGMSNSIVSHHIPLNPKETSTIQLFSKPPAISYGITGYVPNIYLWL